MSATADRLMPFHRRSLPLVCLAALLLAACADASRQRDLYGVWQGQVEQTQLVFRFFEDRTCRLQFTDTLTGSTETLRGDVVETDFTKHPVPLTIRGINKLTHPLHTIVEFLGEDSIRMSHFAPRWRLRPVSFDARTNVYLTRIDRDPRAAAHPTPAEG